MVTIKRFRLAVVIFLIALGASAVNLTAFRSAYSTDPNKPFHMPISNEKIGDFYFVFIGGLLGREFLQHFGYFSETIRELVQLGVPQDQIFKLYPPSSSTVEENAAHFLPEQIRRLINTHALPEGRIVFYAHSKGGPELLTLALQQFDFLEKYAAALVFDAGAFGGSFVSDYFLGDVTPHLTKCHALQLGVMQCMLKLMGAKRGLTSLRTSVSKERMQRLQEGFQAPLNVLLNRMLFIRFGERTSLIAPLLRPTAKLLDEIHPSSPHDGLLSVSHQAPDVFATEAVREKRIDQNSFWVPNTFDSGSHRDHLNAVRFCPNRLMALMGNNTDVNRRLARALVTSIIQKH